MFIKSFFKSLLCLFILFFSSRNLSAGITIDGVENKKVYADHVSFRVTSEAGYDFTVELNGQSVPVDVYVSVDQPEYYELFVRKVNQTTQVAETALVMFIVKASERGNSEWGLPPWVPYPEIPSAASAFADAGLEIVCPRDYPAELEIPVIGLVKDGEGKRVGLNGNVTAAGFQDYPLTITRGVGYVFLPAQSTAAGSVSYPAEIQSLQDSKQVNIEETTSWEDVSGQIASSLLWEANSRIHITSDLVISGGVTVTIGEGSVIMIAPGKEIFVDGKIIAEGSRDRPVVFTPEDRSRPWGGMVLSKSASVLEMTYTILTGSGADPNWFDNNPGFGHSHKHEECLFHLSNGAHATFNDSYIIDNKGQAGHGEDSFLTMNNSLIETCITGGQYNSGAAKLTGCAIIGFPAIGAPFEDNDNDAFYMTGGAHTFTDCLIGWALDDGVDAGSGSAGSVRVHNCWFESCFHEGMAWSETRDAKVYDSVAINCGQGIECGFGKPNVWADHCFSTANLIGVRFGDNYDWSYDGFIEVQNSLILYNKRDIWGKNWDDWTFRLSQMNIHDNYISVPNPNHPDNTIWNPAEDAELLEPFLTVPDSTVGIGIASPGERIDESLAVGGIPVRLSTFTRNQVSVDYVVKAMAQVIVSGTLVFEPGESVKKIELDVPDIENKGSLQVVLSNPVNGELNGLSEAYLLYNSTLIQENSEWKYFDEGHAPASDWASKTFDDSSWKSGEAELGFGDGDESTVVNGGPSNNRYRAFYFRRSLEVANPASFDTLMINLRRDDGGVVYINGEEVFRSNMPSGVITYATWASGVTSSESAFYSKEISASVLQQGLNVIAVEVHQADATSSDISFALKLVAKPALPSPGGFLRGDANGDGLVDISDAIKILMNLFGGFPDDCEDAFDVNDSGSIDIADPVYLLSYLFAGGALIPEPFPGPGEDATDDELDCQRL